MLDRNHLSALAAIAKTGSFEAAAAILHVTPSAVSQRIKALEERLGTVLLVRGQPVFPTEPGLKLVRYAEAIALMEKDALAGLGMATEPVGVKIAINADSLATWILPALAATPDLLFDIVVDDQDHSAELLRKGEVVAGITADGPAVQGCDAIRLGSLRYVATASTAFVKRWFSDGVSTEALSMAPSLTFNLKDRLQRDWVRAVFGRAIPLRTHMLPSSQAFVSAARLGLGWGMNPEPLVREQLGAGDLVELVVDTAVEVPLAWQVSRLAAPALMQLTKAIRREAQRHLV